jgi:excisionase family DNA binding protein
MAEKPITSRRDRPPSAAQVPIQPRLLTVDQAAAYVGFSRRTVLRMVEGGKFPQPLRPLGPGTDPRWDMREIDRWIDALVEGEQARAERIERLMRGA